MNYQSPTINLIDTHAHLTWDSFKADFQDVISNALDQRVATIINVGADLQSSQEAAVLNCSPLKAYSSIGIHPSESRDKSVDKESLDKNINKLKKIYQQYQNKVVAVGECGLDYFFQNQSVSPVITQEEQKAIQKELFLSQINLANELNLPLIIHCRPSTSSGLNDAWEDIFIKELKSTEGVFHSFTGNIEQAQKILELGYYLGFNCTITYPKNEILRQIIKSTPLERILAETDCPFLPPQHLRGQRNEPANVVEVIKTIAEVKNITIDEVANTTFQNACHLFQLS